MRHRSIESHLEEHDQQGIEGEHQPVDGLAESQLLDHEQRQRPLVLEEHQKDRQQREHEVDQAPMRGGRSGRGRRLAEALGQMGRTGSNPRFRVRCNIMNGSTIIPIRLISVTNARIHESRGSPRRSRQGLNRWEVIGCNRVGHRSADFAQQLRPGGPLSPRLNFWRKTGAIPSEILQEPRTRFGAKQEPPQPRGISRLEVTWIPGAEQPHRSWNA